MDIYTPEEYRLVYTTKIDFGGRRASYNALHIMQYDRVLPVIACELYFNGEKFKLDYSSNAKVRFNKPDGNIVYTDVLGCSEERDIIYFEIGEQMAATHGYPQVIIELINLGNIKGSSYLNIIIDKNPMSDERIVSKSEVTLATVAKTGSYLDLKDTPTDPETSVTKEEVQAWDTQVLSDAKKYADDKLQGFEDDLDAVDKKVDEEITRAKNAEAELDTNIKANASAIETETTNRETAVSGVSERVTAEETNRKDADDALDTRIDDEKTRAEGAEQTLSDSINSAKTDIDKLKTDTDTLKTDVSGLNDSKQDKATLDDDVAALGYIKEIPPIPETGVQDVVDKDGNSLVDENHIAHIPESQGGASSFAELEGNPDDNAALKAKFDDINSKIDGVEADLNSLNGN